jgi:hypothetical protein
LRTPAIALARSKASVAPERFTTVSCISSRVVNRCSQDWQQRRRRIEEPSSATRESRTLVSLCLQNGQYTAVLLSLGLSGTAATPSGGCG